MVCIISFNTEVTPVYVAHNAITKSPYIKEWWHFLNGTYLVTTDKPVDILYKDIKTRWNGGGLLLMEASKPTAGMLPREAWDWINSRIKP